MASTAILEELRIPRQQGRGKLGHPALDGLLRAMNSNAGCEMRLWNDSMMPLLDGIFLDSIRDDVSNILAGKLSVRNAASALKTGVSDYSERAEFYIRMKRHWTSNGGFMPVQLSEAIEEFYHRRVLEAKIRATGEVYRGMHFGKMSMLLAGVADAALYGHMVPGRFYAGDTISLTANKRVANAFASLLAERYYDAEYTLMDAIGSLGFGGSEFARDSNYPGFVNSMRRSDPYGLVITMDASKLEYFHTRFTQGNRTEEEITAERVPSSAITKMELYVRNKPVGEFGGQPDIDTVSKMEDAILGSILRTNA